MKRYIVANAKKIADIGDDIESVTPSLIEDLAQLYIFPNTEYTNHWRQGVWSTFSEVSRTKKSHKLPRKDFILKNGWNLYKQNVKALMNKDIIHESHLIPDKNKRNNVEEFYNIVDEYMNWIAEKLSKEGIVDSEDIYNKLEQLGL